MTHYIPYFTRRDGRAQEAACGKAVTIIQHSPEPTCPTCAAWIAAPANSTSEDEDRSDVRPGDAAA